MPRGISWEQPSFRVRSSTMPRALVGRWAQMFTGGEDVHQDRRNEGDDRDVADDGSDPNHFGRFSR